MIPYCCALVFVGLPAIFLEMSAGQYARYSQGWERNPHPWSRHLSPDPDFTHPGSRIPDLGSRIPDPKQQKREGWKNICCHVVVFEIFFIFDVLKKKNLAQFFKNYWSFYPKNFHLALKSMGLGAGIRDPEKTYSGSRISDVYPVSRILIFTNPWSRIQGSKRHRIPDPDPQHCI